MSAFGQSMPLLGRSSPEDEAGLVSRRRPSNLTSHVISEEKSAPHRWVVKCCYEDVELAWQQILFSLALLCLVTYCIIDLFTRRYTLDVLEDLIDWLKDTNVFLVMLCIIAVQTLWIVALLPMSFIVVATAYIMGAKYDSVLAYFVAFVTVYTGYLLGASLAFLLGRHIMRSCAVRFIAHIKVLTAVDHVFITKGKKLNLLLRLNPLVPYNIFNYAMGMTSSTYPHYLWGTMGALPSTLIELYVGLLINDASDINDVYGRTSPAWIVTYCLLALLFIVTAFLTYRYTYVEWYKMMDHINDRTSISAEMTENEEEDELSVGGDRSTSFGTFTPGDVGGLAQRGSP